jgi:hypothetical protein
MIKLDALGTAKDKAEKNLSKIEADLKQQLQLNSQREEHIRSLEADGKVLWQQNQDLQLTCISHEKQQIELNTEIRLKNDFTKELKQQILELTLKCEKLFEKAEKFKHDKDRENKALCC